MGKSGPAAGQLVLALLAVLLLISGALADGPSFRTYDEAAKYIRDNHPQELDVGTVRYRLSSLLKLKEAMGEGALLHFTTTWDELVFSDRSTEIDLKPVARISADDIETLIALCPELRSIRLTSHYYLRNKPVITLMEKYPDIDFTWQVTLKGRYNLATDSTAYSTFNEPDAPQKLQSSDLEVLKYVPGLRALDLGHNEITSLDWLQYCPDLELLILGDNKGITDLTPIGNLKHLKYLELFSVGTDDISPLAGCTELVDLNLCYDKKVTDLSALDGLEHLERFWGNHMDGLSKEEIDRFTLLHGDTESVFFGQHATSDGWRDHERYDHYRWCLLNRKWIPFGEPLP